MIRRVTPTMAFALSGAVLASALGSEAGAAPVTCGALHRSIVLQTSALKVVAVKFRSINRKGRAQTVGRRFLACAQPNGRAFEVGRSYREYAYPGKRRGDALDSGGIAVGTSAGTFVTVQIRQSNLTGDYAETTDEVVNASTGHAYRYFHYLLGGSAPGPAPPARVLVNGQGQLAGVFVNPPGTDPSQYTEPAPGQTEVVGFNAAGARTVFDRGASGDIPPGSLTLTGNTVGWTDKGKPMTAAIS